MKVWVSPTGNIIRGHVLDTAVGPLVERLRDYDPLLYVRWNSKKLRGWGCWEVRRKPELKSVKDADIIVYQKHTIVCPKYHELDLINHVMDVPFLNYSIFEKLKKMDMWNQKDMGDRGQNFGKEAEYLQGKYEEKIEDQALREKEYNIKQHKSLIREFKEYVLSGHDPYEIARVWDKAK